MSKTKVWLAVSISERNYLFTFTGSILFESTKIRNVLKVKQIKSVWEKFLQTLYFYKKL
ncbi:hypothetical protein EV145_102402 [Flavobacterium sp. 245]|nr:hypothetical protein EV145_102402 [Flavobacterium sp. 245]